MLIRANGEPTYLAADVAYHRDKLERGAELMINVLGADHHGYIGRIKAAAAAFGYDPASVEVLIGQMVSLTRSGVPVRMSKRAGNMVSMEDLVEGVGVDAARYALIRSSVDSPLDIDLDSWSRRTNENPVFYVQYAHARLASLQRNAAELGARFDPAAVDFGLLAHPLGGGAAGAAPGRAVPGGAGQRLPQVLRLVPGAADG